ncbi:ABC transporter substrate-binding protein/permease [Facklamia miroungae]|uniref:Amine acid ABC transporter, permease protein, 3-TM region, His/Glu/Gln/Arg/opine family n=1 Tax=Facklamia miroungae TaxID=120956 RepID=A0A1G7SJI0_9LACT|nr:ABC transporter substrate-binding protein/permease [Facklamia miroungae]NKZ29627.1 ABC transporter substrate-binding protein/permease [Facklamia miroungae]SDG23246.1 amine acid ABC transporter, permease protein, 3-TM region, His/Glu/Gln/Arg/opine family [Facklamia miroungae]
MKKLIQLLLPIVLLLIPLFFPSNLLLAKEHYTVGTSGQTKPLNYFDDQNNLVGIEIEILQEIDRRNDDLQFDFEITEFSSLFAGLDSGQFDLVANNLGENPERREKFLFSIYPYIITHNVLITSLDSDNQLTMEKMGGKTFGVVPSSPQSIYLEAWNKEHPEQAVIIKYADSDPASLIRDVYNGRIDATIYATTYLKDVEDTYGIQLKAHPIANEEEIRIPGSYFIFRKDQEALRQKIDQTLQTLRQDGTLKAISQKYLGQDDTVLNNEIIQRNQTIENQRLLEKSDNHLISIEAIGLAFPRILEKLPTTLLITLIAGLIGLILGFILAMIKLKKVKGLKWLVNFFVSYMRGTPLLVQLFLAYYGLPIFLQWLNKTIGTNWDVNQVPAIFYAFLAMGLNEAAYNSETIRSAILSVDPKEIEAAYSIGLNSRQAMLRIILPSAMINAIPNLGNSLIRLLKGTSLAFTITVIDMMGQAKITAGANLRFFEAYIAISLIYWGLCILLEWTIVKLEHHYQVS